MHIAPPKEYDLLIFSCTAMFDIFELAKSEYTSSYHLYLASGSVVVIAFSDEHVPCTGATSRNLVP